MPMAANSASLQADSMIAPLAPGTWESAMNAAFCVQVGCERSGKLRLVEEQKSRLAPAVSVVGYRVQVYLEIFHFSGLCIGPSERL